MREVAHAVAVCAAVLLGAARSAAAEPPGHALQRTGVGWLAAELTVAGAIGVGASYAAGERASECGWCGSNAFDRAARDALLAADPAFAGTISRLGAVGVTPAIALAGSWLPGLAAGDVGHAVEDTIILASSFVLASGIMHGIKKLSDRRRPAFQYGVEARTEFADHPDEEFMSFGSGDTTWAFAFAAAGSTLGFLRGYESAEAVLVLSSLTAAGVAVLRIAADAHWATDVLMGAGVGTAVGVLVPLLMHPRVRDSGGANAARGAGALEAAGLSGLSLALGRDGFGLSVRRRF